MIERRLASYTRAASLAVAVLVTLAPGAVSAQEGVQRSILLRHDLDVPGREAVLVDVSIAPGAREGRHVHPGMGLVHVLAGELTVEMDGEPPRTLVAGDSLLVEQGRVHEGINTSATPVRLLATFIIEKGKPLTTPAE